VAISQRLDKPDNAPPFHELVGEKTCTSHLKIYWFGLIEDQNAGQEPEIIVDFWKF
jgi:hypothetical protein